MIITWYRWINKKSLKLVPDCGIKVMPKLSWVSRDYFHDEAMYHRSSAPAVQCAMCISISPESQYHQNLIQSNILIKLTFIVHIISYCANRGGPFSPTVGTSLHLQLTFSLSKYKHTIILACWTSSENKYTWTKVVFVGNT